MAIVIQTFFDTDTATLTYVVSDCITHKAAIIDSVLNYDMHSGCTKTQSADRVIAYVQENHLNVEWILETHIHADHLTASQYVQKSLGGKTGIGSKILEVLEFWVPIFHTEQDTPLDGSQFDCLLEDGVVLKLGSVDITVLHTPGHTPVCVSYHVKDAVFVGDLLLTPDLGTARTDFPGGSAATLYDSVQKIFHLDDDVRVFSCHEYPPEGGSVAGVATIKQHKNKNILIHTGITKSEYIRVRTQRDLGKSMPKLLIPSIQVNLRAGDFGRVEDNEIQYIKIPINTL